jgi:protein-export membrane protein SecD
MLRNRIIAVLFIIVGLAIGYFDAFHLISQESVLSVPFKLGLDLKGGAHLVYQADVSDIAPNEISDAMSGLRDVIERRVNAFGVGEPLIQIQEKGMLKTAEHREQRLIVALPGVTDVEQAIAMIGETPFLEFRTEVENIEEGMNILEAYEATDLTGRYLEKAILDFNSTTYAPEISIEFDDEGAELFKNMTAENVGKTIAIFLDGFPVSMPRVNEEISGGKAQITGQFSADEAKQIVKDLNSGALPIPIKLISQQKVGATLGGRALAKGINAGVYGMILVAIFLVLWYRLPGLLSVFALALYTAIVLAFFKLIPVTLTASGIAGFILSIGIAVDANILIFERMKEERRQGKTLLASITEGFERAWLSIRDSNVSTLISCFILFWMGTSIVKGFAFTLAIGVLVSMFSAITISRNLLLAVASRKAEGEGKLSRFLFNSGLKN